MENKSSDVALRVDVRWGERLLESVLLHPAGTKRWSFGLHCAELGSSGALEIAAEHEGFVLFAPAGREARLQLDGAGPWEERERGYVACEVDDGFELELAQLQIVGTKVRRPRRLRYQPFADLDFTAANRGLIGAFAGAALGVMLLSAAAAGPDFVDEPQALPQLPRVPAANRIAPRISRPPISLPKPMSPPRVRSRRRWAAESDAPAATGSDARARVTGIFQGLDSGGARSAGVAHCLRQRAGASRRERGWNIGRWARGVSAALRGCADRRHRRGSGAGREAGPRDGSAGQEAARPGAAEPGRAFRRPAHHGRRGRV